MGKKKAKIALADALLKGIAEEEVMNSVYTDIQGTDVVLDGTLYKVPAEALDLIREALPCNCWVEQLPVVQMNTEELESLLEYSSTLPTGKIVGKKWRRYLYNGPHKGTWILCEYIEDPDPTMMGISSKRIELVDVT